MTTTGRRQPPNQGTATSGDSAPILTKSRYHRSDAEPETVDILADALAMAAEAEAEAARAEALAGAALARARAIRLSRSQAASFAPAAPAAGPQHAAIDGDGKTKEPAPRVTSRQSTSGHRILRAVTVVVASLTICALLAVSGMMLRDHQRGVTDRYRSAEFAAAAEEAAVMLLSLDFNDADQDMRRIADHSTGEFHDDFQSHANDFAKAMQASKVVMKASVRARAVESVDGDSAVVLVAATSKVASVGAAKNAPLAWRLRITISRDGDELKMSRVQFLP